MLDGQKTKTVKVVFKEQRNAKTEKLEIIWWDDEIFQYFLMLISMMMSDANHSRFSR